MLAVLQQTCVGSVDILGLVVEEVVFARVHGNFLDLVLVHFFIFRVPASSLSVGHGGDLLRSCRKCFKQGRVCQIMLIECRDQSDVKEREAER